MRRTTFVTAIATAVCLLLTACTGGTQTDLSSETANAMSDVQTTVSQLSDQIENSALPDSLKSTWNDQRAEINQAIDDITAGRSVDTAQLQQSMQDFRSAIESSNTEQSIQDAWSNLQNDVESLLNQVTSSG